MGQILRFCTTLPGLPDDVKDEDLECFLVTEVIAAVRESLKREGFGKALRVAVSTEVTEEGQEAGGLFLIGIRKQIFEIRQDFQVVRPVKPYTAIGYGGSIALGALHALEGMEHLSLEKKSRLAMEAAESYCPGVRAPFCFQSM